MDRDRDVIRTTLSIQPDAQAGTAESQSHEKAQSGDLTNQ